MRALVLLIAGALAAQDAAEIMAKMAANVENSTAERQRYIYQQQVRARLLRTDGKVARQERREYSVLPSPDKTQKELVKVEGEIHRGKEVVHYNDLKFRHKNVDMDGELLEHLTSGLVDAKDSRDGIPNSLFPIRSKDLGNYDFKLVETKDYKGRLTHQIAFQPKSKENCPKETCEPTAWTGDAWIDAKELQPVHIATELSFKMPFVVRSMMGTNVQQTGFAVTYQRVAENVWFPASYGTEFRFNLFFGYKRVVTMSLESTDFRRAAADSDVKYDPPSPVL